MQAAWEAPSLLPRMPATASSLGRAAPLVLTCGGPPFGPGQRPRELLRPPLHASRPHAALSTSSPAPSGPCEPFCPARPLREDAPSSSRATRSSSSLCSCLRAPLSRSLCRRSRAPSLHLHRLDGVSLSRMALAAFRSRSCEPPCSHCFAPLSPPPLSPVLRPPRVRSMCAALCGLRALLPPAPSPSRRPARPTSRAPYPPPAPEGERGVCPPPQSLFSRTRALTLSPSPGLHRALSPADPRASPSVAPARRPFICADSMGSLYSRMALAAFRSRSCELPCSHCFAPLSPPPLSPVLRPPRVRALCGLRALLPPAPSPSRRPVRLPSRAPYPLPAPKGKEAFVRPHKAFFSRPRSAPFALPRFAPGAFPGRLPRSALCRSPGPSCHPGLPTVPRPPPSPSPLRQTAGEGGKRKRPLFPFGKKKSYKTTKIS